MTTVLQCFLKSGHHKGDEKSMEGTREWVISFYHGDVVAAYAENQIEKPTRAVNEKEECGISFC